MLRSSTSTAADPPRRRSRLRALLRRHAVVVLVVLFATAVTLIHVGIQRTTIDDESRWSASVDDTYILFQYARNMSRGHFFKYHPGDPYTTGATCPLWDVFLVVPFLLGAGELQMVPVTLVYGGILLAASMLLLIRLGRELHNVQAGRVAALLWGSWGYSWFCLFKGMESGLYVTLLLGLACLAIPWLRRPGRAPSWGLVVCAGLLPLARPDGLFFLGGLLGVALLRVVRRWSAPRDLWILARFALTLLPAGLYFLSNKLLTGTFSSAGMISKSLLHAPYLTGSQKAMQYLTQLTDTVKDFLTGGDDLYLSFAVSAAGMAAIAALAWRELGRRVLGIRWLLALWMVTGLLAGAAHYIRIAHWPRYYVPFFIFVFLGAGFAVTWLARALRRPGLVAGLATVLVFFQSQGTLHWNKIYERDIKVTHTKQAAAGRTVRGLPPEARVLVCDAGAIPYLSHRWTFDIVGLTSLIRYNYFRHGIGSRFELFERLPLEQRPTHVAAYDFCLWPGLRGSPIAVHHDLIVAPVIEQGAGTGERPSAPLPPGTRVVDRVDVADLESEDAHDHRLEPPGTIKDNELRRARSAPGAAPITDGGRQVLGRETFAFRARAGRPVTLVARLYLSQPVELRLSVGGVTTTRQLAATPADGWTEERLELPAGQIREANQVQVTTRGETPFSAFHYFVLQ